MLFIRTAFFTVGFCLLLNALPQFGWAFGKKNPGPKHLMANLGDSITAATLADTDTFLPFAVFQAVYGQFAFDSPKTLVLIENKKSYSWGSGEWMDSHYIRLRNHYLSQNSDFSLEILNEAVPGAVAEGTLGQAQEVVDVMKSGEYEELSYVTLLVGANDYCADKGPGGTPNEEFRANLKATFAKLAEVPQKNSIKIMVSSIPNVPMLGRPDIAEHKTMGVFSCDFARKWIFGYCKKPLGWQTEDELNENIRQLAEKNNVLREEVAEAARTYPGLELAFGESINRYELSPDLLAMDCFHPNKVGQERISAQLWDEQPWFK